MLQRSFRPTSVGKPASDQLPAVILEIPDRLWRTFLGSGAVTAVHGIRVGRRFRYSIRPTVTLKKNANNCVKVNGDVFIPEFLHGKNISGKDRLYLGVNTMVNPINVDLMRKKHRMNSMCRTPRHSTSSTEQLGRLVSSSASGGSVLWRSFGRFF